MNNYHTSSQGFTLVEVIISIAILSICSVVALQLFITAQNLNTSSRHSDIASVIATNKIESIKHYKNTPTMLKQLTTFDPVDDGFVQTIYWDVNFNELAETSPETLSNYALSTSLRATDQRGLYDIQVTVTDLIEDKVLVNYTSAHYFSEEVSYDALP